MSVFRDKAHLLKLLKQQTGIYSIALPVTDIKLFEDVIIDDTLPTFSTYYPAVIQVPVDLNQIRIKNDRDNTVSDVSNIYEIPNIVPQDSGREILGIESIVPFNDMRYQSVTSAYETIESFQALALAQTIGDLSSAMEPPFIPEFIPPNRFRIQNGTYYKDRVIIKVEISYSEELYDIPMSLRQSFFKLALLDVKRYLYHNLKYWDGFETAVARFNLKIEDWADAEGKREELINDWDGSFHLNRVAAVWM